MVLIFLIGLFSLVCSAFSTCLNEAAAPALSGAMTVSSVTWPMVLLMVVSVAMFISKSNGSATGTTGGLQTPESYKRFYHAGVGGTSEMTTADPVVLARAVAPSPGSAHPGVPAGRAASP